MDYTIKLSQYERMLAQYIEQRDERALYKGQKFSRKMLEQHVSPEDVVSMHIEVVKRIIPHVDQKVMDSLEFLLEVMIGYGFAYREHQSLRTRQEQLDAEIDIAANIQKSLVEGEIPSGHGVDIGVISKPAKKMSGDYYHFVQDDHSISVAIADVVGKGIPAAMCMSMIKYAMDSLPDYRKQPGDVLSSLNHVVEQNIDPSMFITMFYGVYHADENIFSFASAGHEPGFFYNHKYDRFEELVAKGSVLGLRRHSNYTEYRLDIEPGDMIILLSDGVTECRTEKGFLERGEIADIIRSEMHSPAQRIVDQVYYNLEMLQDFVLRDDFTLIVLKF
ncbi:PP2C family protein-serine/threonine phosphatase [Terrilactibacillus laevilacticus]|uniref:PP2C family protein-serine/threonine phosphatase n=1 Tax=Terrilactibacillus laevilacticus TaxID=1380157 RepID=A0ABW5PR43_9BACI|nr:PP2C family protein-serine/threonine phosphatase [Terrilactibacillus laevilacticus]